MEIFLSYVKCISLLNIVCLTEVFTSLPKTHQSFTNIQYSENEKFLATWILDESQFAKISNSTALDIVCGI